MPPYQRLKRAEAVARERFPQASDVRALWTPANEDDVTVEVWTGSGKSASARVLPLSAVTS